MLSATSRPADQQTSRPADQQTIDVKADVMLEHFIEQVVTPKKLKGQAKGMVITQNIESAIR